MLYLFYEGGQPIGIFDFSVGTDTNITVDTVQGGMIGMFAQATDAGPALPLGGFDEYGASLGVSPGVKTVIVPATSTNGFVSGGLAHPLVIMDDGSTGYGTTYGHQFGHEAGLVDDKYFHAWREGKLVGPNTIAGSGKVTGWITPGLYGTDFYSWADFDPEVPPTPGTKLYVNNTDATLTISGGTDEVLPTSQSIYFVSFLGDPSLVSTSFVGGTVGGDTKYPVMLFMWK